MPNNTAYFTPKKKEGRAISGCHYHHLYKQSNDKTFDYKSGFTYYAIDFLCVLFFKKRNQKLYNQSTI